MTTRLHFTILVVTPGIVLAWRSSCGIYPRDLCLFPRTIIGRKKYGTSTSALPSTHDLLSVTIHSAWLPLPAPNPSLNIFFESTASVLPLRWVYNTVDYPNPVILRGCPHPRSCSLNAFRHVILRRSPCFCARFSGSARDVPGVVGQWLRPGLILCSYAPKQLASDKCAKRGYCVQCWRTFKCKPLRDRA